MRTSTQPNLLIFINQTHYSVVITLLMNMLMNKEKTI